jgi:predicted Zn-dependent protease
VSEGRVEALEAMLARRPDDSRLRFGLALEYLRAERLEDGIRELRAYLAASDDEGNAWGRLGAALLEAGHADEARDAYGRGVEAARRHGHPTMAEEFEAILEDWPAGPGVQES